MVEVCYNTHMPSNSAWHYKGIKMTLAATKKALAASTKAFTTNPSATNWKALEHAMYAHQEAHQLARLEAMHSKVYAQSAVNA